MHTELRNIRSINNIMAIIMKTKTSAEHKHGLREAFTFISSAMDTLKKFEKKFVAILSPDMTPTDK